MLSVKCFQAHFISVCEHLCTCVCVGGGGGGAGGGGGEMGGKLQALVLMPEKTMIGGGYVYYFNVMCVCTRAHTLNER